MQKQEIILESIELDNFAGSDQINVQFYERITTVSADNGRGKTRLLKAFIWLLFDKNEDDRKDFNIKNTVHLDRNRQESIVGATLVVNGSKIALKKVYKEKWQKKQGTKNLEFTGNETVYFYDGVPCSKTEYKSKIDALVNEDLFKLLTNVGFFNRLQWQKQRDIIFKLVPEVTDDQIDEGNSSFESLLSSLTNGKTIAEYKREIAAKKVTIKKELDVIPARIDQEKKALPEPEDFDAIANEIIEVTAKIQQLEEAINDVATANQTSNAAKLQQQQVVNDLKSKLQALEFQIKEEASTAQNELSSKKRSCRDSITREENEVTSANSSIGILENRIKNTNLELDNLRAEFVKINASVINEDLLQCSECGAELSKEKRDEIAKNFTANKVRKLENINEQGGALTKILKETEGALTQAKDGLKIHETNLTKFKNDFTELVANTPATDTVQWAEVYALNASHIELTEKIKEAQSKITNDIATDPVELKLQKLEFTEELDALKLRQGKKNSIAASNTRINELIEKESTLAQEIADFENIEFNINNFEKARIDRVEEQVNAKFQKVKFKLFDTQVNGAEVPVCEALIDGVPYSDANTASKILAGLDIIQTLSDAYGVYAPVFIDNAESISEIPLVKSQLIKLRVAEAITKLSVSQ